MVDLTDVPALRSPVVLSAFEGWNDAADAASGVIDHLATEWRPKVIAELDPEHYYDYQMNRPMVTMDDSGERRITWPSTTVSVAEIPGAGRDAILIRGIEPSIRWQGFCGELVSAITQLGAVEVVTLGALLADTPHTRPIPVNGSSTSEALRERLGVPAPRYEGPTGIVGVFQEACSRVGFPAVSYWAAVPHYVSQTPCPKATLGLLGRLEEVLGVPLPHGDLVEEARAWERGVNELASEDEEIADYVRALEESRDTAELPEASGDAIAAEFERYLRRRDTDG